MHRNQNGFGIIEVVVIFGAILLLIVVGLFVLKKQSGSSTSGFATKSYSYNNYGIDFSFNYPIGFATYSDSLKQNPNPTTDGLVVTISKMAANETIIGYVRVNYEPEPPAIDIHNLLLNITNAVNGSRSAASSLGTNFALMNQADCSNYSYVITDSRQALLECALPKDYVAASTGITGRVLLGYNKNGIYLFQYYISNSFWNENSNNWSGLFKTITYK